MMGRLIFIHGCHAIFHQVSLTYVGMMRLLELCFWVFVESSAGYAGVMDHL